MVTGVVAVVARIARNLTVGTHSSQPFIVMGVVYRFFNCSVLPTERGVTLSTPHLVTPIYLIDECGAFWARARIGRQKSRRFYIVLVADVLFTCLLRRVAILTGILFT